MEQNRIDFDSVSENITEAKASGGEGGIRTLGTLARTPVFETGLFNHSSTSPARKCADAQDEWLCSPTELLLQ